jgi:hypothetical protein
MKHNLALGFIKPHASKSLATWESVRSALERQGVRVYAETWVSAEAIRERGLIDRHYAVIARIGGGSDPTSLELDDQARSAFQAAFGIAWDEACTRGGVFSGMEALRRLKVTAKDLMAAWSKTKASKIGPGFYAASIEGVYVLNGFYPSIREIYTEDGAGIRCFLMEFDGETLSWKAFRANVIGATDPAKAAAGSVRGELLRRQEEFGLQLNARDNVIHASASPFEALMERLIWLPGFDPAADPLVKAVAGSGITVGMLSELARRNPILNRGGKTASAIDLLEDIDTPEAASIILGWLGQGTMDAAARDTAFISRPHPS